jgi:hypothetical protein
MGPQAAKQTVKDKVPSSRCLLCADSGFSAAGNSIFAAFVVRFRFQIGKKPISPDAPGD